MRASRRPNRANRPKREKGINRPVAQPVAYPTYVRTERDVICCFPVQPDSVTVACAVCNEPMKVPPGLGAQFKSGEKRPVCLACPMEVGGPKVTTDAEDAAFERWFDNEVDSELTLQLNFPVRGQSAVELKPRAPKSQTAAAKPEADEAVA